jgi:hypothetical protein
MLLVILGNSYVLGACGICYALGHSWDFLCSGALAAFAMLLVIFGTSDVLGPCGICYVLMFKCGPGGPGVACGATPRHITNSPSQCCHRGRLSDCVPLTHTLWRMYCYHRGGCHLTGQPAANANRCVGWYEKVVLVSASTPSLLSVPPCVCSCWPVTTVPHRCCGNVGFADTLFCLRSGWHDDDGDICYIH